MVETPKMIDKKVLLKGWVNTIRDHGKVQFIDLRDRSGIVQCVVVKKGEKFTPESVLEIVGMVKARPKNQENPDLETGTVEIEVEEYKVLNLCKELPIPVDTDGRDLGEDLRLRYRYLDLRRERMGKMMRLRSKFVHSLQKFYDENDFVEVETPLLTMGTTEGSRNFIVPSRLNPGKFYALPQSPQQYKQLLMTAGVERYIQFARCIRDEDLKSDRAFEHTQVDLEMSFVEEENVMEMTENSVKHAVKEVGGNVKDDPFPVFTYEEAMKKFGSDKFDLRTDAEKKQNMLAFAWVTRFPFFKKVDTDDAAEVEDTRSGWVFTHNPFSRPIEEHISWHLAGEHIDEILTSQYDLVCNGYEIGGGSIRAHEPEVLRATYKIMGYSDEEIEESIGHMLEALELGTPPHGGIAMGVERLLMVIAGEKSMKETMAFPMTGTGKTAVTNAPSEVSLDQLKELGLQVQVGETDVVFTKVKKLLDGKKVNYKVLEHKPVKTSEEAAKIRGTKMGNAPKAMVLAKKKGELLMVCVPADKQIDLEKASKIIGEKVKVASAEEVEEQLGLKVGAVPPFGKLFGIEMYMDGDFWKKDEVVFNAGRRDRSIRMKAGDLIKVAEPSNDSKGKDFKK